MGYVTLPGGYRVGIAGQMHGGTSETLCLQWPGSFNIRIARQITGAADLLLGHIWKQTLPYNTLVISPPCMGKTTVIRDAARAMASGWRGKPALKVGIADERNELSGSVKGQPQLDVGVMCDVITGCSKAEGIAMLLRTMSPQVIVTDEIGRMEDSLALQEARNAGVAILASAHGAGVAQVMRRPCLAQLFEQCVFERVAVLGQTPGRLIVCTEPPAVRPGSNL